MTAARERSPGGWVVVLFGSEPNENGCTLNRCPVGMVRWFPTNDAARAYADTLAAFEFDPHFLRVEEDE